MIATTPKKRGSSSSSGLPKAIEEAKEKRRAAEEHPIEDFLKGMFGGVSGGVGDSPLAQDQEGLPPLDWLKSKFRTKSAAIRYLVNQKVPIKTIAAHLGIRYQHARNVATQQLKRGPNESWQPKPDTPPELDPTDDNIEEG